MLKPQMKILIAFNSTTNAMAVESYCKSNNIEGRMIPLPRKISAGCGICWISPIILKDEILKILIDNNFKYEEIYEMEI